ncbi:MAG: GNAT family N-acetyltransferase [Planctomycetota bacterium]
MTTTAASPVVALDRAAVQRWLPELDDWLLPGAAFGVQHTWPLLYRSDGRGRFFGVFDGGRLIAHCATRAVQLVGAGGPMAVTLLGSVATAPDRRDRGHASNVLGAAIAQARAESAHVLLWAERPELYARAGFAAGRSETCVAIARLPHREGDGAVRLAAVADHAAIHALHEQKPWRVRRTVGETSGLLTTPGLECVVLEREGAIAAYACCGKGADLADHWHELGGSDADVAALLQVALHLTGRIEALVLVPPYRAGLVDALGRSVVGTLELDGPMALSFGAPLPDCFVDGLDSV